MGRCGKKKVHQFMKFELKENVTQDGINLIQ